MKGWESCKPFAKCLAHSECFIGRFVIVFIAAVMSGYWL